MGMLGKESLHKKKAFSKSKNHLTASKIIVLEWIVKGPSKTYKFILTEDYVTISSDHRFFKMSIAKIMSLTEVEFCSSYLWWTGNALKGSGWLIWIACLFDHSLLRSWNCVAGVVVKNKKKPLWSNTKPSSKRMTRRYMAPNMYFIIAPSSTFSLSHRTGEERRRQPCVTSVTIILFETKFPQTSLSFNQIFLQKTRNP